LSDVFCIQNLLIQEDSLTVSLFNLREYAITKSKEVSREWGWNTEPYGLCRLC